MGRVKNYLCALDTRFQSQKRKMRNAIELSLIALCIMEIGGSWWHDKPVATGRAIVFERTRDAKTEWFLFQIIPTYTDWTPFMLDRVDLNSSAEFYQSNILGHFNTKVYGFCSFSAEQIWDKLFYLVPLEFTAQYFIPHFFCSISTFRFRNNLFVNAPSDLIPLSHIFHPKSYESASKAAPGYETH